MFKEEVIDNEADVWRLLIKSRESHCFCREEEQIYPLLKYPRDRLSNVVDVGSRVLDISSYNYSRATFEVLEMLYES